MSTVDMLPLRGQDRDPVVQGTRHHSIHADTTPPSPSPHPIRFEDQKMCTVERCAEDFFLTILFGTDEKGENRG